MLVIQLVLVLKLGADDEREDEEGGERGHDVEDEDEADDEHDAGGARDWLRGTRGTDPNRDREEADFEMPLESEPDRVRREIVVFGANSPRFATRAGRPQSRPSSARPLAGEPGRG